MKDYKSEFDYDDDRLDRFVWKRQRFGGKSRREVLKSLAAVAAGAGIFGGTTQRAGAIVKPIPANLFRTIGTNRETRFEAFKGQGYIPPASLLFIRNHTDTPIIDPLTWNLTVDGPGVTTPASFTLAQLKALPSVTLIRAIECAGNSRSFFNTQQNASPAVTGSAWRSGAIGVGKWKGVRLSTLLNAAGIKSTAVDVLPEGLDNEVTPAQGRVRRPLPASRALQDDVLVVYELNDEPLPPDHGFPARLLVPGWIGIANIKWLGRIQVFEEAVFTQWNTGQYRFFGNPTDYPGEPILTVQTIKSTFELPWLPDNPPPLVQGSQLITGRSWSAAGTINRVDVSFNDGGTWQRATLKPGGNGHQAWAEWRIPWSPVPGSYVLKARATDNLGNVQPLTSPYNGQGYLFNAQVRHAVNVA